MAENATLARPYAQAAYDTAKKGSVVFWGLVLDTLAELVGHPDVRALILNPSVHPDTLVSTLMDLLRVPLANESQPVKRFVHTLAQNGRLIVLPQVAAQFHQLNNADEGIEDVQITSAFEMDKVQIEDLLVVLRKKFYCRLHPNPKIIVDPSLIGGVRAVVGNKVFDMSIKAKLRALHNVLLV